MNRMTPTAPVKIPVLRGAGGNATTLLPAGTTGTPVCPGVSRPEGSVGTGAATTPFLGSAALMKASKASVKEGT